MVLSISSSKKLLKVFCAIIVCHVTENFAMPPRTAQWIWHADKNVASDNQAIVARKIVTLNVVKHAAIKITADSYYRLFINGVWINDGPCRSWPEHFQYDIHDVTPYLHPGENEIKVIARYYDLGDSRRVVQQAGLWVQLDLTSDDGRECSIISDQSWLVARLKALIRNTPRISSQGESVELYDARLENEFQFTPAGVLFETNKGQWHDLNPRDTELLTRTPTRLQSFLDARIVQRQELNGSTGALATFFHKILRKRTALVLSEQLLNSYSQFEHRQVLGDARHLIKDPEALMHGTENGTTIMPNPSGDIELLYDLGEQNCGYWAFDLIADEGNVVDIAAVEYIAPDGRIQHTGIRNCLRYITKKGLNSYTSFDRRSGRYIFITLRNQTSPIYIRHFQLFESTYPVIPIGNFSCSDTRLNEIWKICCRTLKLCMEDTFTDCPLYEQTAWIGDLRNEALVGYHLYRATGLALRTIKLAAQSLEKQPIVAGVVPYWLEMYLPAWSFLWNIATWDYYWYTGDKEALARLWPAIIGNIQGAANFVNDQGLFDAPMWNFFDWTTTDQKSRIVLHNSMLLVGAVQSAIAQAQILGYSKELAWLIALRAKIVAGINKLWDDKTGSYPDSIHDDGTISDSTCQHTSFLSILYDIIEQSHLPRAVQNLLNPPPNMVKIGSPFALHYLFEAYEKLGLETEIIKKIYGSYGPMLDAGATTCWEILPEGTMGHFCPSGFPTRSHCHGWSTTPGYFLPRIILGIKSLVAGGKIIQISPLICNLTQAKGTVATINGPVTVAWGLDGDTLSVDCTAPAGTELRFLKNHTMESKKVMFNGMQVLERADQGRVAKLLSTAMPQQARRKELAFALASAYHDRLGQSSPVGMLPKGMLRDIVCLAELSEH